MRNIFDQYGHPENRLSHALATCLHEDPAFLREFVRWTGAPPPPRGSKLSVLEQSIPFALAEDVEGARRGLPDIWIYDAEGWCLLVESKIAAGLGVDQLRRHVRTAQRAGFEAPGMLTLTLETPRIELASAWKSKRWRDLYCLVQRQPRGSWASRLAEYMEIAETQLPETEYMTKGTLTAFDGIHFDDERPYTTLQARRLLRLLMDELRGRPDLAKLGVNASAPGRPAITGGEYVWDFLTLRGARPDEAFTAHPHLDVGLHRDHVSATITLPHGTRREIFRHLTGLGESRFVEIVKEVARRLTKVLAGIDGARPILYVNQRHYPSQRAFPITDASLEFDLRTLGSNGGGGVKEQPEWALAAFRALEAKRSNMQMGIGAQLPYGSDIVRSLAVTDAVAGSWIACEPWLCDGLGIGPR